MVSGGCRTTTREGTVEQVDIGDGILLHPSPVGKFVTALPCNLKDEELRYAVVDSVIVGLYDAFFFFVLETEKALLLDGSPEQRIDFRIRRCVWHGEYLIPRSTVWVQEGAASGMG
jgi:hypothetical protein